MTAAISTAAVIAAVGVWVLFGIVVGVSLCVVGAEPDDE